MYHSIHYSWISEVHPNDLRIHIQCARLNLKIFYSDDCLFIGFALHKIEPHTVLAGRPSPAPTLPLPHPPRLLIGPALT